MTQLVFIHGRCQEHKNAVDLKAEWVNAFKEGLGKSGLALPLADADVRFPYYGQTLYDLVHDADEVADAIVRGAATNRSEAEFLAAVVKELQTEQGITDQEVQAELASDVVARGPLNWEWVQGILRVVDRRVPGGGSGAIALATRDVYRYLRNPGVRDAIEAGVRAAFTRGTPTVVVSHSLGTVVAFNLLRREGVREGWTVPLFVTLGSPLGVTAIRKALAPIGHPSCVAKWFNAFDQRDVVALFKLDDKHFGIDPAIENKDDVRNRTSNRHGIAGYLDDAVVARRIHDALV